MLCWSSRFLSCPNKVNLLQLARFAILPPSLYITAAVFFMDTLGKWKWGSKLLWTARESGVRKLPLQILYKLHKTLKWLHVLAHLHLKACVHKHWAIDFSEVWKSQVCNWVNGAPPTSANLSSCLSVNVLNIMSIPHVHCCDFCIVLIPRSDAWLPCSITGSDTNSYSQLTLQFQLWQNQVVITNFMILLTSVEVVETKNTTM